MCDWAHGVPIGARRISIGQSGAIGVAVFATTSNRARRSQLAPLWDHRFDSIRLDQEVEFTARQSNVASSR